MLPADELPLLIVIDEPELGLHPYALDILASLCRSASAHSQILISTQSSTLVNKFTPADVVVVERDGESSGFVRPDASDLEAWLEDYSLGEIWEKNVIGGRSALMARLYVFAEGPTEQTFADILLKPHLAEHGVYMNKPVLIAHAHKRQRTHRGGGRNYHAMQKDIVRFLKQTPRTMRFFTSMIDLHAFAPGIPWR